ncbi:MAG: pyridoxamine 5'-phosphate oxidase [bacterium]
MKERIEKLRREYVTEGLRKSDVDSDPWNQFKKWFSDAVEAELAEPNAMVLSTANRHGKPSSRVVLMKDFDEHGIVFYTNYESRKGRELSSNPHVSLVFFWPQLARQVRIEGTVRPVDRKESEEYFRTRPRESQIGAWASHQSSVISSREELEQKAAEIQERFSGVEIPIPPTWGGFRLEPAIFEFWQGRESRLHDRIVYEKKKTWLIFRLSP